MLRGTRPPNFCICCGKQNGLVAVKRERDMAVDYYCPDCHKKTFNNVRKEGKS